MIYRKEHCEHNPSKRNAISCTHFHARTYILQDLIDHRHAEVGMVSAKIIQQHGKEMHIGVLDLPNFGEYAVQLGQNLAMAIDQTHADRINTPRLTP